MLLKMEGEMRYWIHIMISEEAVCLSTKEKNLKNQE